MTAYSKPELVWDRWQFFADNRPEAEAIIHWVPGEAAYRWTFGKLCAEAQVAARQLRHAGVKPGDVVALILRHNPRFYPIYMGVASLGAIPAVLAYPNSRLHADKFRDGLVGMSQKSGLDWVLTERELESSISPLLQEGKSTVRGILFPFEFDRTLAGGEDEWQAILVDRAKITPDSPFLLQHSSGTTGLQKAVMLSHRAILDHVALYGEAINLSPADKVASWLPLYHDMGLIAAFHLPVASGIPCVQIDPFQWVIAPVIFLEAVTQETCTLAWLPNFAFNLMADRIHTEDLDAVRLDSLRMVINCSEPVRAESHQKFVNRFTPYGLPARAMAASYAMAETTFAVTQTEPHLPARIIAVDRERLANGTLSPVGASYSLPTRLCVSSGRPVRGCQLRIVGENRQDLPPDVIGELAIRSVSMFSGYRNNPEKTGEVVEDGWYFSGDLGFAYQGEYYIIGRKKDIIIVAGKNVYPEDIEDAVGLVPGVLPGRVVAFGEDDSELGTEQIDVVAETAVASGPEQGRLKRLIVEAGMQLNLTIARVYLVPPRWLIKSSSGKPSRKTNKERILSARAAGQPEAEPIG
jgi:fatty-acyl-CoA synthase